ncbi:hypothetical protein ACGFX4_11140 [Kitasatospora sp. NPDC048365]|uniref:hypothetical protein n=1 Tax=Kitasatospora sp. NPDC048365 TaxID=3364050 RepID=UPI0037157B23
MKLYLAVPLAIVALLTAASGIAALSRGWLLPSYRRHVRRPRLYGWGQLVVAFALSWQVVFLLAVGTSSREWATMTGSGFMLVGLLLLLAGQRPGRNRSDDSAR